MITLTDNIIDDVVMCIDMTICQQVNPPKTKCLDPPLYSISIQMTLFLHVCKQIHIQYISIGSFYPEVCAFGTLIMPTKVFRLIICKTL